MAGEDVISHESRILTACRRRGLIEAASYIEELGVLIDSLQRGCNQWRGIAAAMGFEPDNHLDVRPTAPWLLDRIARFRARAAEEVAADLNAENEKLRADARRYRHLRNRDAGPPNYTPPGLFIGQVPENLILTEEDADAAIDAALAQGGRGDG